MTQLHTYEKKQFEKLFKQEHIDYFEDRYKVLETFLQTEQHVTIAELLEALSKREMTLTPEFVEETLELMVHFGFAQKMHFDNGDIRYEHRHLGQHHDHALDLQPGKRGVFTHTANSSVH